MQLRSTRVPLHPDTNDGPPACLGNIGIRPHSWSTRHAGSRLSG
jgi:hypothetical protein